MIFLNSADRPLKSSLSEQLCSRFLPFSHSFAQKPIWFPCVMYESCRIYNTSWFPFCPDELSCPLSCCNYDSYTQYMPMLFSCAQLPPPLKFFVLFLCLLFPATGLRFPSERSPKKGIKKRPTSIASLIYHNQYGASTTFLNSCNEVILALHIVCRKSFF